MTLRLNQTFFLETAGRYANPKNTGDKLPIGFGDLTLGSSSGISKCPCIDTVNHRYMIFDHPIDGSVAVYVDQELQSSGYTAYTDAADENGKDISYIEFSADPGGVVTCRCKAYIESGSNLLENLADIANAFLTEFAGLSFSDINAYYLARSRAAIEAAGWKFAGVIDSDRQVGEILSDMLYPVGDYYIDHDRKLAIKLNTEVGDVWNVSGFFSEARLSKTTAVLDISNLANQVTAEYAYNAALGKYDASDDGDDSLDLASQRVHGAVKMAVQLNWVRDADTVYDIQSNLVALYKNSLYTISFDETGVHNLHLLPGDYGCFSWGWLFDENLTPWVNRIVRIISTDPDPDKKLISFGVIDTGHYLLADPKRYDGTWSLGGAEKMGGERDLANYAA